ncbi:polymorphic toxin type 10 domain-containing protein (plasmid) [Leptospira weilii]|uniref:RHS repeat domain-containing protein n=1 Tax=Leptospira weilii TaxID=28184 RepID=UPI00201B58BA|nr:polymorphic toxin type 10 domain-containing protein [Leptospira weilii]UPY80935.1 polymorphic toxin type 10 domain-containing protein [Leptospira weilii]
MTFFAFNLLTGAESPVREAEPPYPLIPNSYSLETYDANGNLTRQRDNSKDLTKRISVDSQDRITQIQDGNGATLGSYWYDESGFRIRKSSLEPKNNLFANVEILYPSKFFGLEFIESESVISSVNNVYLNGVRIAALNEVGALAYFLTDQVDSVSLVLDDEGNSLSQMQYLPYGETFVQRGDTNFAPKYNSQELDRESGFYFYNARYYDPGIARFTSADTVIPDEYNSQSWNRFSYVNGNPIQYKDPTGHLPQDYDAGFKDASKDIAKGYGEGIKSALAAPTPVNAVVNSAVATGKGVYELAKDYKGTYEKAKDFAGKLTSKDDKVRDYAAGQATAYTMNAVLGGMAGKALGSRLPKPKVDVPNAGASSAANSVKLNKSLASEAQMKGKGTEIFKSDKLRQAGNLAKEYGGESKDWAKMSSKSYTAKDGTKFETHWYENTSTGLRVEPKTKLSR